MSAIDPTCLPWQTAHDFDIEGRTTIIGNVDGGIVDGATHHTYDFVARTLDLEDDSQSHSIAVANAEFIVRACNSHPALLEAAMAAYRFISQPQRMDAPAGGPKTATYRTEGYNELTGKLRAAIAKAKGAPDPVQRCHCGAEAATTYDGDRYCRPCATYSARRDFEESEMPGGFE